MSSSPGFATPPQYHLAALPFVANHLETLLFLPRTLPPGKCVCRKHGWVTEARGSCVFSSWLPTLGSVVREGLTKMEVRMGAFMIHHREELIVSQHLNRAGRVGRLSSVPKPRICYSPHLPPASCFELGPVVCLPVKPGQHHKTQGLCSQMIAARGRGWDNSSPEILKIHPDNGPYHDEDNGHSWWGQRRKEDKETGREHRGEGLEEEPERGREKKGWMLRALPTVAQAVHGADSPRVSEAISLRVCDHLDTWVCFSDFNPLVMGSSLACQGQKGKWMFLLRLCIISSHRRLGGGEAPGTQVLGTFITIYGQPHKQARVAPPTSQGVSPALAPPGAIPQPMSMYPQKYFRSEKKETASRVCR